MENLTLRIRSLSPQNTYLTPQQQPHSSKIRVLSPLQECSEVHRGLRGLFNFKSGEALLHVKQQRYAPDESPEKCSIINSIQSDLNVNSTPGTEHSTITRLKARKPRGMRSDDSPQFRGTLDFKNCLEQPLNKVQLVAYMFVES